MNYKTYRRQWRDADTKLPAVPLNLDLELSTACNLKCPFCFIRNPKYSVKPQFMRFSLAKRIIDKAVAIGIPAIKMNWRGESTLNPDFNKIAEYLMDLRNMDKLCETLLNTNGNYHRSKRCGVYLADVVAFSIDSFSQKYDRIRVGGDIKTVICNIDNLLSTCHPGVEVRRVITPFNKDEDFAGQAKQLFGDKVKVVEHYLFDRSKAISCGYQRKFCGQPNRRIVIDVNGECHPCCVDYMNLGKMGNFLELPFTTIQYRLKCAVAEATYHQSLLCNQCTSYSSYDCQEAKCLIRP